MECPLLLRRCRPLDCQFDARLSPGDTCLSPGVQVSGLRVGDQSVATTTGPTAPSVSQSSRRPGQPVPRVAIERQSLQERHDSIWWPVRVSSRTSRRAWKTREEREEGRLWSACEYRTHVYPFDSPLRPPVLRVHECLSWFGRTFVMRCESRCRGSLFSHSHV